MYNGWSVGLSTGLSMAVHAAIGLTVGSGGPRLATPAVEPVTAVEVEVTAAPEPAVDPLPLSTREVEVREERRAAEPGRRAVPRREPTVPVPAPVERGPHPSGPAPSPDALPRPTVIVPDARTAAIGTVHLPDPVDTMPGPSPSDRARDMGRALAAGLAAEANTPGHVSRRPPPELHRMRDGGYEFRGHAFTARIAPDGEVSFSDQRTSIGAGGGGAELRFDLTDGMYRRRGLDPYQAERSWFMRETAELRDSLTDRARERLGVAAARSLRGRLLRVWGDRSKPPAERRRTIFRMWDQCAEDEVGWPARRAIEAFIRESLPAGSPDAFSGAELARLNATRQSSEPLNPY